MTTIPELRLRQGRKADVRFITNSWLKSYRDSWAVKGCPNDLYYKYQHKVIEALLPSSGVLVLCDTQDEDHIVGWMVYQRAHGLVLVHYLYVKYPFRKHGFARQMVEQVLKAETQPDGTPPTVIWTHKTKGMNEILHHYRVKERRGEGADLLQDWIFDPFKLWLVLPDGWWK